MEIFHAIFRTEFPENSFVCKINRDDKMAIDILGICGGKYLSGKKILEVYFGKIFIFPETFFLYKIRPTFVGLTTNNVVFLSYIYHKTIFYKF